MERETIFGGGGDHKQRKVLLYHLMGKESIFKEREHFLSSVFLQSTKCCKAVQTGIPLNRSRNRPKKSLRKPTSVCSKLSLHPNRDRRPSELTVYTCVHENEELLLCWLFIVNYYCYGANDEAIYQRHSSGGLKVTEILGTRPASISHPC
jgi:hypothetical protein